MAFLSESGVGSRRRTPRAASALLLAALAWGGGGPVAAEPASDQPEASESSAEAEPPTAPRSPPPGNPINKLQFFGTGALGRALGLPADGALHIGGVAVGSGTVQFRGGSEPGSRTLAGFTVLGASLDLEKALGWKGAKISVSGLQYNVQPTNADAGTVQGIVSAVAAGPTNRTELYNYLFVQDLFDQQVQVLVGKLIPTITFGNATAPDPSVLAASDQVPSLTALLYTPVFVVPTMLGRIPGYPDSALGLQATIAPNALGSTYLSAGVYDGRLGADGTPTGLDAPNLRGPLFSVVQVGTGWQLGSEVKPGQAFFGAWHQGGGLRAGSIKEDSAWGLYGQVSQRLSHFRYGKDSSGLNVFLQAGWTPATTNLIGSSIGGGLTIWAPFASRPRDSYGIGLSWAAPNNDPAAGYGFNASELILQAYAQIELVNAVYLQPTLSVLPRTGLDGARTPSMAASLQITALF